MVASGNKQARTSGVWVATKASSSSKRRCLWGNADGGAHRHQVCHKQVYGRIRYNSEESSDIPQRYITKSGQEPIHGGFLSDNVAQNTTTDSKHNANALTGLSHNVACLACKSL